MSSIAYLPSVPLYERMCKLALVRCFNCERLYVDPKHSYGDICGRCQIRQERRNARATTGRDNDALASAYWKMYLAHHPGLTLTAWHTVWRGLYLMTSDATSPLYHHAGMLSARATIVEIIAILRGATNAS